MEILRALEIINAIKAVKGDWQCFYASGEGDLDEDTATRIPGGKVTILSGATLRATYKQGKDTHELRGSVAFSNFRYREIIKWDGVDVSDDDIYLSSHLTDGDDRRVLVQFNFRVDGKRHSFRFVKRLGV